MVLMFLTKTSELFYEYYIILETVYVFPILVKYRFF